MVRAELVYNPYLLETEVLFDGNPPRINSLVEKYKGEKLQTWIAKVPSVFYDEMNGYYFELYFSGTELDFEELKKSFAQAGVGKDLVPLFHKGELADRRQKLLSVEDLLKWLENNPNRKFDFNEFHDTHRDLFNEMYPYVVIGGTVNPDSLFEGLNISVDNVESVDELRKTDLHSTPILFYLDRKSSASLQYNLLSLMKRKDVKQEQLFFMISPAIRTQVTRTIQDLGVKEPQIVTAANDEKIYRYIELFPISDYIYDAVKVFQKETRTLGEVLEEENRQSEIMNKDIHEKIKELDDTLSRLKTAYDLFAGKENLDIPQELVSARSGLVATINEWKKRKTKITRIDEAAALAYEFEAEVNRLFENYKQDIEQIYSRISVMLLGRCDSCYKDANYKEDFVTDDAVLSPLSEYTIPDIASELMKIKEEQYVTPKEDFLGIGKLFKTTQESTSQEPVLETTFYCENWRSYAVDIVDPIAEQMIQEAYSGLREYYEQLSALYIKRIESLIQEVSSEKEQVSLQLSADERLLQADNDWHTAFCDKLRTIERA